MMTKAPAGQQWYDFFDDWDLIEASLLQQYGLRIRKEANTISWSEFRTYVSGLLPNTPLGKMVQLRSEMNENVLKSYTPAMRYEREKWLNKMAQKKLDNVEQLEREFSAWESTFAVMFGDENSVRGGVDEWPEVATT